MSPVDFERLRQGGPDCPSEVMLHRLRAGELAEDRAQEIKRHLDGCERCTALVARQASGFDAWPEVDPVRMLSAIRRGADERAGQTAAAGWRSRIRAALAPIALAGTAAAAVIAVLVTGTLDPRPDTRFKGGPVLHVFRQRAGAAVEVSGGEPVLPGEPLQLTMDVPADGVAQVAGVEPGGAVYLLWPQGGAPFAPVKAGAGQRVPGAFALDDAPGPETFHLAFCPSRVREPSCKGQGAGRPLDCTPGCTIASVPLQRGQ